MNSEAVRQRNARKRAKLRAKKSGKVFIHVFVTLEKHCCSKEEMVQTLSQYPTFTKNGRHESLNVSSRIVTRYCDSCHVWLDTGDYETRKCPMASIHYDYAYVFRPEETSVSFEEKLYEYLEMVCRKASAAVAFRCTVAVTKEGQRRVKEWLVTAEEEVEAVAADVLAVVFTPDL